MITHTVDNCKYCHAQNTIITDFSAGQVACKNCGAVIEDRIIDETYERRTFGGENSGSGGRDQTRVGGPSNVYSEGMNLEVTIASKKHGDVYSKKRHRTSGSSNSSLNRIFQRAEELAQKLKLKQNVVDKSKDLLQKVEKEKKLKGRSLDCIIASALFEACRLAKVPHTLTEISNNLGLDRKTVNKCFNSIKSIIIENRENQIQTNVSGLVNSCCNKMELEPKVKNCATEVAQLICKSEIIAGRNPSTIAGASILIASKLLQIPISKKDIAEKATTTENTITNAYQEIVKYKEVVIPAGFKDKICFLDQR